MSKISTVVDTVRTAVTTLFANRREMSNPYSIEDHPQHVLDSGFGIAVTSMGQSDTDWLKSSNVSYTFEIILTNIIVKLESDRDKYYDGLKVLLEDELTLRQDLLAGDQLGIQASINKVDYVGTSGIEKVIDKNNHIYLSVAFDIDISEDL